MLSESLISLAWIAWSGQIGVLAADAGECALAKRLAIPLRIAMPADCPLSRRDSLARTGSGRMDLRLAESTVPWTTLHKGSESA